MKSRLQVLIAVIVLGLMVSMLAWLPTVNAANADASQRGYVWNSGTDLNGPAERVMIEIPLHGRKVATFKITITYAYGGEGWTAFMNRGGPQYLQLADTGGAIQSASFTVAPEFVNRDGYQNVTVRGVGTLQGLHLYSIEVVPLMAVPVPAEK
jgi:hypothetical protein